MSRRTHESATLDSRRRIRSIPSDTLRRAVDVVVGVAGGLVLLPLIVLAAVLSRLDTGPGIIYRQRRLGRAGRPFELLKFRSMKHPQPGREAPSFDGERISRIGTWLRATSLDELPSLWNLIRGDLSLVGPRPLPVHYWDRFRGDEYVRFTIRPGITGLAQVAGRNSVDWTERLALDVEYVRTRSLLGDLRILAQTGPVVFSKSGVNQAEGVTMTELPRDRPDASAAPAAPAGSQSTVSGTPA